MMNMQKWMLALLCTVAANLAEAQWLDTKKHLVLSVYAGGNYNFGDPDRTTYYHLAGRGMYYPKRMLALGADLSFTQSTSQFANLDAMNLNLFGHLKFPLGLYAEAGYGLTGTLSDGRSGKYSNTGLFWAAGIAKSIGPRFALDLQYRSAPSQSATDSKNLLTGLRLGASIKI